MDYLGEFIIDVFIAAWGERHVYCHPNTCGERICEKNRLTYLPLQFARYLFDVLYTQRGSVQVYVINQN